MFDRVGAIEFDASRADADAMMEAAIEAGAEDVSSDEDGHEVICAGDDLAEVQRALEALFGEPRKAGLIWRPQNTVAVDDETAEKLLRLVDNLQDNDDVQNVTGNFELSDAMLAKLSSE